MNRKQFFGAALAAVIAGIVGKHQSEESKESFFLRKLRDSKCVTTMEVREHCRGDGDKWDNCISVECPDPDRFGHFIEVGEVQG